MAMPPRELVRQSWEHFLSTGDIVEAGVGPPILRSWRRSAAAGIDPWQPNDPSMSLPIDATQQFLIGLARPCMEDLYRLFEGSGFAVLLTDAALTLIEVIGDSEIVEALQCRGLGHGMSWQEERIGTMGVNLALHEAQPCQTCGPEHFRVCHHLFACSAAPLFDVAGQVIGVLGVIGGQASAHPHTLGMVIAATQAIHSQLRNNLLLAQANDHLVELNVVIEAISEGLIFIDPHSRLSKINSRAGQILGLSLRSAVGRLLDDVIEIPIALRAALDRRREIIDQELLFATKKGSVAVLCSMRPVWDRGRRYIGTLIMLRPPAHVQRLVQRMGGAQARFTFADIVDASPAMQVAVRQARIAANSRAPILISGEPGVGKERFAHAIHMASTRAGGPFVVINCAETPRSLLMGELLGYEGEQDAEQGPATPGQPGKMELAQGGTLLLEEISALTLELQTSLLRAIETKHLIRVGGRRVVPIDVRLIATTRHDMACDVAEGRFRADLFQRLYALTIDIPPLRERGDDVLLLIDQMMVALHHRTGKHTLLAPDALLALRAYRWPGNVRELETTLERLFHTTEKSILSLLDLPSLITREVSRISEAQPAPLSRLYDRHAIAERDAILHAGRESVGHLGHTAERLGISRATLWRKMKLYGISKEHFWSSSLH